MFFRRARATTSPDADVDRGDEQSLTDLMTDREEVPGRRGPSRTKKALLCCLAGLAVLIGLFAGGVFVISEQLGDQIHRYPNVFGNLDEAARPPKKTAKTFLIVGTDSRSAEPTTGTEASAPSFVPGSQRSDVVMLMRVEPGQAGGEVVSLPRDSWVPVPGHGTAKINAAYSFGGPSLLVRTVEELTRVRVDHFGVIDFAGFKKLTDAVGGIDVTIAAPTTYGSIMFHQGSNHLDGEQALAYVRQRHELPRGDLDRVQRQQNALRALLTKLVASGMLSNPSRTYEMLDMLTQWIGLDDTLTNAGLRKLTVDLRNLAPQNVTFVTTPVRGTGMEGDQSVVYLDRARGFDFWQAFGNGTIQDHLTKYPGDVLGDGSR